LDLLVVPELGSLREEVCLFCLGVIASFLRVVPGGAKGEGKGKGKRKGKRKKEKGKKKGKEKAKGSTGKKEFHTAVPHRHFTSVLPAQVSRLNFMRPNFPSTAWEKPLSIRKARLISFSRQLFPLLHSATSPSRHHSNRTQQPQQRHYTAMRLVRATREKQLYRPTTCYTPVPHD
jgi:hypothetical protein